MKSLSIPLRIVLYREDGDWVAHCLEFDVCGHGNSHEGALDCLGEAISIQVEHSIQHQNFANLLTPADGKYLRMFAQGSHRVTGELKIQLDSDGLHIEDVDTREYRDEEFQNGTEALACG